MSNTDITSQIVAIIQPFFVEDILNDNILNNSEELLVPPLDDGYIKLPKIELNRRTGLYGMYGGISGEMSGGISGEMSGGITKELLTTLLNGGSIPPSLMNALGGFGSDSFIRQSIVEESSEPIGENTLYCDQCNFHTNDQICMMDHTLIYHDLAFNEYACDRCNSFFQSMMELDEHIAISHKKKTIKREKHIEDSTQQNDKTKKTVVEDDEEEEDEEEDGEVYKYSCRICGEYFQSMYDLEEHVISSHPKKTNDASEKQLFEEEPEPEPEPVKNKKCKVILTKKVFSDQQPRVEEFSSDDERPPPPLLTVEEIARQKLHRWSSSSGKFQCQICHLKFRSQNHLGEHFMENHQSYEDQLELDQNINTTSFPGFEVLAEIEYSSFPENENYYDQQCEICCEQYLVGHDKKIKLINSSYLDEYVGETLYPVIVDCCKNNHTCHKCLAGYLNESYLNGMLYCPFCQQDRTRYGLKYLSITDIQCNKKTWQQWWIEKDRLDILAFEGHHKHVL